MMTNKKPMVKDGVLIIPAGTRKIADGAFAGRSDFQAVQFPASLRRIGEEAFIWCEALKSVLLPRNLVEVSPLSFGGSNFTAIDVVPDNPNFASVDGVLYSKDMKELILCPCAKKGALAIPSGVTTIADCACGDCRWLKSVTLPDTLTRIGAGAFEGCAKLRSITIPPSVIYIGDYAFQQTSQALVIHLPKGRNKYSKDKFTYGTWTWWYLGGRKNKKPLTVKIDHRGTPRAR